MDVTGGHGADVTVNVAGAEGTIAESIAFAARNGVIVLGVAGDELIRTTGTGRKNLTIKWAHGHSYRSVERAIQTIASGEPSPWSRRTTSGWLRPRWRSSRWLDMVRPAPST